jgi:hypothetical protein
LQAPAPAPAPTLARIAPRAANDDIHAGLLAENAQLRQQAEVARAESSAARIALSEEKSAAQKKVGELESMLKALHDALAEQAEAAGGANEEDLRQVPPPPRTSRERGRRAPPRPAPLLVVFSTARTFLGPRPWSADHGGSSTRARAGRR